MSIVISFGEWQDTRTYDAPDGSSGQVWRKGFAIRWAKPVEKGVLFSLKVHLRINGIEVEEGFIVRENVNA